MNSHKKKSGFLVGVGFDNEDGHKRITRAENFYLAGGSQETHEQMTETAIKTMEDLNSRGKNLGNVEPKELRDIIHKNMPRE
ncbi:MAG: hypothetical protein WD490_01255 [Opitutales bacterium]